RARQEAVAELRGRLDLREDLALLGANVPHGVDFGALVVWGQQPAHLTSRLLRAVVFVVGLVALAVTLNYLAWFTLATPDEMHEELFLRNVILLATLGTAGGIALALGRQVHRVVADVEERDRDLNLLAGVLARLEREHFSSPRLTQLRTALDSTGDVP